MLGLPGISGIPGMSGIFGLDPEERCLVSKHPQHTSPHALSGLSGKIGLDPEERCLASKPPGMPGISGIPERP